MEFMEFMEFKFKFMNGFQLISTACDGVKLFSNPE